jgi:hypothetical protein
MNAAVRNLAPHLGSRWGGGTYAGVHSINHLILGPDRPEADWPTCMAWAEGLADGGLCDWQLPDLAELRALIAAFPDLFQRPRWWTRLTCPNSPDQGMIKHLQLFHGHIERTFDRGTPDTISAPDVGEGHWGKQYPANACAIRLVPIHGQRITPRRNTARDTRIEVGGPA